MSDSVVATQALNNIRGIITNEGLSYSIQALQHEGWKIYPRAFAVSEMLSLFDNSRTTESMNTLWYEGPISGVVQQNVNTLEFLCTIPPGVTPDNKYFREIYITALTENDQPFLLGLGQIDGDVIYNPGGATKLRIIISIQNVNIANLFEFRYTQATEVSDHNNDPNSHPDIRQLLTGMAGSTIINTNYYSQAGDTVFVDSRNNSVSVSLPIQDLTLGTRISVIDIGLAGAVPGREIIVRRNGNLIDNRAEDFRIDTSGGMVEFFWHPAMQSWRVNIGGRFYSPHPDSTAAVGTLRLSSYIDPSLMFATGGLVPEYSLNQETVNAVAGNVIFVDTSNGSATIRLPLNPSGGHRIQVADILGTAATHNIIVTGQGNRVAGSSVNYRISVNFAIHTFIWEEANQNWLVDIGGIIQTATEATAGLIQLATTTEAKAGTNTNKAVTPAGLATAIGAITVSAAGPATATANGSPIGTVTLAADSNITSRSLAATPAGVASQVNAAISAITSPIAGAATATANGTPAGIVQLAADNNTTSRDLAATPGGVASRITASLTARTINTTSPLTGGGNLSADRTLAINDATTSAKGAIQMATAANMRSGTAGVAVTPDVVGINNYKTSTADDTITTAQVPGTFLRFTTANITITLDPDGDILQGTHYIIAGETFPINITCPKGPIYIRGAISSNQHVTVTAGTTWSTPSRIIGYLYKYTGTNWLLYINQSSEVLSVSRSGDTMTGSLYVGESGTNRAYINTSGSVQVGGTLAMYKPVLSTTSHYNAIAFQATRPDGTTNTARNQILSYCEKSAVAAGTSDDPSLVVEGRGQLILGSGEAAGSIRNITTTGTTTDVPAGWALWGTAAGAWNDSTEQTTLASDNHIYFMSACNTIASSKMMQFNTSGNLYPGTSEGQALGTSSWRWDANIRNLNVSGAVTGIGIGANFVGDIRLIPFRYNALPSGWYYCNGDSYALTSNIGIALNALSTNFKTDWAIAVSGSTISLPNMFYSDGRGYFIRSVNGTTRLVGPLSTRTRIENDAIRDITGAFQIMVRSGYAGASGAIGAKDSGIREVIQGGGWSAWYYGMDFSASRQVPTADENRPLNVGMTPAIFLGV